MQSLCSKQEYFCHEYDLDDNNFEKGDLSGPGSWTILKDSGPLMCTTTTSPNCKISGPLDNFPSDISLRYTVSKVANIQI